MQAANKEGTQHRHQHSTSREAAAFASPGRKPWEATAMHTESRRDGTQRPASPIRYYVTATLDNPDGP